MHIIVTDGAMRYHTDGRFVTSENAACCCEPAPPPPPGPACCTPLYTSRCRTEDPSGFEELCINCGREYDVTFFVAFSQDVTGDHNDLNYMSHYAADASGTVRFRCVNGRMAADPANSATVANAAMQAYAYDPLIG